MKFSLSPDKVLNSENTLLLGVDGGGSKTSAHLAILGTDGQLQTLGQGLAGPSNLRLAGKQQSLRNLDLAINSAFEKAGLSPQVVAAAVLALAGSTHTDIQDEILHWAESRQLCLQLEIVHDIYPLIYAGTNAHRGIALIVGTGSVAMGINSVGQSVVRGGWGHWFGDEGSGYDLGCKALAAIARASDGMGNATLLTSMVQDKYKIQDPRLILSHLSHSGDIHREIAALAPLVLKAAEDSDPIAINIVDNALNAVIKLVDAVAQTIKFKQPYPLILAGGIICKSRLFQQKFYAKLADLNLQHSDIHVVNEPVIGCLKMAKANLLEIEEVS